MMIGKRSLLIAFGMGLVIALPLPAQDPASRKDGEKTATSPAPAAKKKGDPSRRVPDYFGQIGLTPEQRESIYKLRKTHQEEIDSLRKQIAAIEARSLAESEAVLTDTQRKLLDNLRAGGSRTTKTADAKSSR